MGWHEEEKEGVQHKRVTHRRAALDDAHGHQRIPHAKKEPKRFGLKCYWNSPLWGREIFLTEWYASHRDRETALKALSKKKIGDKLWYTRFEKVER